MPKSSPHILHDTSRYHRLPFEVVQYWEFSYMKIYQMTYFSLFADESWSKPVPFFDRYFSTTKGRPEKGDRCGLLIAPPTVKSQPAIWSSQTWGKCPLTCLKLKEKKRESVEVGLIYTRYLSGGHRCSASKAILLHVKFNFTRMDATKHQMLNECRRYEK